MLNDLRFAFRVLLSRRWFSAAIIVTLALGIGINTTVFTLVHAVLFKPVPIPGGERLVTVSNYKLTKPEDRSGVSWLDYQVYQAQNRTFEGLEAAENAQLVITERDLPPERLRISRVTTGMFSMLRTPPVLGRGFSVTDGQPGAAPVVLLGHAVWESRYDRNNDVIGRTVQVNERPATIIGVMPAGFKFPNNEQAWMPLVPTPELEERTRRSLRLFGLLRPDGNVATANQELAVIAARLAQEFPETNQDRGALVRTFHDTYNGDQIRTVFLMMLGAVGFVLLIACANVGNMMLSRALVRAREMSLRSALGATRWQLIRQMLVESVLLSVLGGVLGLALTAFGVRAFDLATQDVGKPYWIQFEIDYVVFGYFAFISVLCGLLFGLVPALRASRVDLNTTLKDGMPAGGTPHGGKLAGALVVFQFALTVVLLAGAGMMMRSFFAAQSLNGFVQPETVFTARLQLPEGKGERYEQGAARLQFYEQLLPALAALPGVRQVAATTHLPGLGSNTRDIEIDGRAITDPKQPPRASFIVQSPGFLPTIGLPLLSGRGFDEQDGDTGREGAIVTRTFAAHYWPDQPAVGQRFRFIPDGKPGPWITVLGVSADLVQNAQRADQPPLCFIPLRQESWGWMGILLRTTVPPSTLAGSVRSVVQQIDQNLPLYEAQTMSAALERERWFLAVFGTLFLVFALTGLLMASVGIYAVVAHTTSRRTREIGLRMALGATNHSIVRLVLSRGVRQLVLGLVLGLGGALAATQLLAEVGFLIQVSPHDPFVFIAITAILATLGVFACWLPARKATRIAPTEALRTD